METQFAQMSDICLWNEFRAGSSQAFAYIFNKYSQILKNYGRKFTSDLELIEDCVQDLFVELLEKRSVLSETDSIKFYLYTGLRRRLVRVELNQARLGKRMDLEENSHWLTSESFESKLVEEQVHVEQLLKLQKSFAVLSNRKKQALRLRYFEQCCYNNIAQSLSIDVNSAYKLVYLSLREIRNYYFSLQVA